MSKICVYGIASAARGIRGTLIVWLETDRYASKQATRWIVSLQPYMQVPQFKDTFVYYVAEWIGALRTQCKKKTSFNGLELIYCSQASPHSRCCTDLPYLSPRLAENNIRPKNDFAIFSRYHPINNAPCDTHTTQFATQRGDCFHFAHGS